LLDYGYFNAGFSQIRRAGRPRDASADDSYIVVNNFRIFNRCILVNQRLVALPVAKIVCFGHINYPFPKIALYRCLPNCFISQISDVCTGPIEGVIGGQNFW
jgi:hypothetical protein